ncbi:MAG: NAD(P)/FAD-dependent oxidoreductase [Clostridiales bacterium]|nr:NAD(P)/FAD-dependent oxidoreductase [Clostridiales bacterium]
MKLLESIKINNMELRNRIFMPPMETRLNTVDGDVTSEMLDYYAVRAQGGAGLVVVENTFVDAKESRSSLISSGLYSDHLIRGKNLLAEAIKGHGAAAVIQLSHGGRQCTAAANPLQPVAPSTVMCNVTGRMPRELPIAEIHEIEDAFAQAARRAKQAGFDGVEIHGAHGYLVSSFFSPYTNRRTDEYGGSMENRGRLAKEILEKVRAIVGAYFIVGIRMNGSEFYPDGGLTEAESPLLAKMFEPYVDYISVSGSTYETGALWNIAAMYVGDGPMVFLADAIKKVVDVPVVAVASLDAAAAERVLEEGKADMAALGRALIADPELPNKLAQGRAEDILPCCRGNEGCITRFYDGKSIRCELNPACGRERAYGLAGAARKKVAVIGGGIGGMEAARVADLAGHGVTLYEKTGELGGHLIEGSVPDFKEKTGHYLEWLKRQVGKGGVKVSLNTEIAPDDIAGMSVDAVIIAVGSEYISPNAFGIERAVCAKDALMDGVAAESVAVIGGGLIGCETALMLAEQGKKVTVLEMLGDIVPGHEANAKAGLVHRMKAAGVDVRLNTKVAGIGDGHVECEGGERIECGDVVNAAGLKARKDLAGQLAAKTAAAGKEAYIIGDCKEARKIYDVTHEAWQAVLRIGEKPFV